MERIPRRYGIRLSNDRGKGPLQRRAPAFVLALLLCAPFPHAAAAQQASDAVAPEVAGKAIAREAVTARKFMVVTAHEEATRAGEAILAAGGSAVDAMVAVQAVLGLVEPQSSGLGGGAFLVHWDAASGSLTTLDGRETAPIEATPDLFLDADGQPMDFYDAVIGGRSVGTPGTVALMETAHAKHGKLDWASLFEPAIKLAESGFKVSPRLNASISESAESLAFNETTRQYFLTEEAVPLPPGTTLKNPEYADTLRLIAKGGARAFYGGPVAMDIVATVRGAEENPGRLSLDDLAAYTVKEREPVCASYRVYEVCGMGPPSSGALTIGQILKLVEPFDLATLGPGDPQSWRLIGDASRLAFADREAYMADPDYIDVPKGLLNADYMKSRSQLLRRDDAIPLDGVEAGEPPFDHSGTISVPSPSGLTPELPSTSHFSIVDGEGDVVSMTTTIENSFGSRLMVRGFLLNNELTDFSFVPARDGQTIANRVESGKRPRSSMAPTIVLKDGKPVLAIGSPGGSRIIGFVAQALIAHLDWGMDINQAVAMPHLVNRYGPYEIETGTENEPLVEKSVPDMVPTLEALGYEIKGAEMSSGLHAIAIKRSQAGSELVSGVDPRREGFAAGR